MMLNAQALDGPLSRRALVWGLAGAGASVAGLALLNWPGLLRPPSQPSTRRIGFIVSVDRETSQDSFDAFTAELRAHGWVEGQNLIIEWREAKGRLDRFPELAMELVRLPVEILVVNTTSAVEAARAATTTIPIVTVASTNDPVAEGWAESLARPGGNITGSALVGDLEAKRVELLNAAVPSLRRVGILYTEPTVPTIARERDDTEAALRSLNREAVELPVQRPPGRDAEPQVLNFEPAFRQVAARAVDALVVVPASTLLAQAAQIADLALKAHLPGAYPFRAFVDAGGLMSFGASSPPQYQLAASLVDRILRGAKPAELPFERPAMFEFVVNQRTVQSLGLHIPPDVAAQVTEWVR